MDHKSDWLNRESDKLNRQKKRRYLHFDFRIKPENAIDKITNPKFVASRSFLPFIESQNFIPRYKFDDKLGKKINSSKTMKTRPICYASHLDSMIYSWYNFLLEREYENKLVSLGLNNSVIAYRSIAGKCNIDFAHEVFEFIKNKRECVALNFDIEKFFETLDHELLLAKWKEILNVEFLPIDHYKVFKSLTKFSYVNRDELFSKLKIKYSEKRYLRRICNIEEFREKVRGNGLIKPNQNSKGIPQGSPISGLLSNIYMLDFDKELNSRLEKIDALYRRYSDDIIIICDLQNLELIEALVYKLIEENCKLVVHSSKTDKTIFESNESGELVASEINGKRKLLQYLGFEFDGKRAYIRSSSLSRYYRRMKKRTKLAVYQTKYSKINKSKVFKRKLYEDFSHLGKRNFITYAYRASEIMNQNRTIRKQVKNHWKKLHLELDKRKKSILNKKTLFIK